MEPELTDTILSLRETLEDLCKKCHYALQRIDTIRELMERDKFVLKEHRVKVIASRQEDKVVQSFLQSMELSESVFTMENFIKQLNRFLICKDYVDLNDLWIRVDTVLATVFKLDRVSGKVPYVVLFKHFAELLEDAVV